MTVEGMPRLRPAAAVLLAAVVALVAAPRPARACDPAEYWTALDLADQATIVAVVDVTAVGPDDDAPWVTATTIEALKGAPPAALRLTTAGGTCAPGVAVGRRGIIFADAGGAVIGLYDGFLTEQLPRWTATLRAYLGGATAAERAAPLAAMAAGRDWTSSYQAAYALAHRDELVRALDDAARARLIARARAIRSEHPLHALVRRFSPPPRAPGTPPARKRRAPRVR